MEIGRRDAFDLALVAVALVLVVSQSVSPSDPAGAISAFVAGITSVNPVVYLVVVGLGGIVFMAYGLLYLPTQRQR